VGAAESAELVLGDGYEERDDDVEWEFALDFRLEDLEVECEDPIGECFFPLGTRLERCG